MEIIDDSGNFVINDSGAKVTDDAGQTISGAGEMGVRVELGVGLGL